MSAVAMKKYWLLGKRQSVSKGVLFLMHFLMHSALVREPVSPAAAMRATWRLNIEQTGECSCPTHSKN